MKVETIFIQGLNKGRETYVCFACPLLVGSPTLP